MEISLGGGSFDEDIDEVEDKYFFGLFLGIVEGVD